MKKIPTIITALILLFSMTFVCNVSASGEDAVFTIGTADGTPGDTVELTVELDSSMAINSIAFHSIAFNGQNLEFVGFKDYEHLDAKSAMPIVNFVDVAKKTIIVPLKASEAYSDKLCTLIFKIKDDSTNGTTVVTASSIIKNDSTEGISTVKAGAVNISGGKDPSDDNTSGGGSSTPGAGTSSGGSSSSGGGSFSGGGGSSSGGSDSSSGNTSAPDTQAPVVSPAPTVFFSDLSGYDWAKDAIVNLASQGIIKGTSATTYAPSKNITRADFAILLVRAFKLTSDDTTNFADVSASDYFAKELSVARNTGIVGGIGNNKYAPRNNITRQDMMTIVYRALKALEVDLSIGEVSMADFAKVSDYAKDAVSALVSNGLVNGKNGLIDPTANTTRAEVAVLLDRILEYTSK